MLIMKCTNSCIFRFWFERQDVKMLIKHQKPPPQYETPPPPAPPTTSQSDTAETDSISSSVSRLLTCVEGEGGGHVLYT